MPRLNQRLHIQRQRTFQPDNPKRSRRELDLFLFPQMRRMIRRQAVDRAVLDSRDARRHIRRRSQWRIHLEIRVISPARLIRQQQDDAAKPPPYTFCPSFFARRTSSTLQAVLMC